jgi:AraC-like DNA-binding protein
MDGETPVRIEAGDSYLMTDCPGYVLASDPELPAVDGAELYRAADGGAVRYQGDEVLVLGGGFLLDEQNGGLLKDVLPPLVHIPGGPSSSAILHATLQLFEHELGNRRMGSDVVMSRMGDILLVQALRAYVAGDAPSGWLGALGDARIGAALRLMHGEVGRNWTVEEIAAEVGMSRSTFARRFRQRVGASPLDYLLRWRMHLARHELRKGTTSIAGIAYRIGYSSESAFANAFKRTFGQAPRRYWKASIGSAAGSMAR